MPRQRSPEAAFPHETGMRRVRDLRELEPTGPKHCSDCRGNGLITNEQEGTTRNCTRCDGTGKELEAERR